MEFDWDPAKARANDRKHGITFNEAATVFADPLSITITDPDHSLDEQRFIIVGTSEQGNVLVVAHATDRDHIRLVSARKLTRAERRAYEEEHKQE